MPDQQISRRAMLRLVAFGGVGAAATLLPACGGTAATPSGTAAPASGAATPASSVTAPGGAQATPPAGAVAQAVKLRVWGTNFEDTRAKARLDTFTAANPAITIEPVGGELNTQQLLTAVASGDPPEVVTVDRLETGSWAGRGAIDPLDDLVSRDGFDFNQFYPFLKQQVTYRDKVYGVPQFVNVDMLFMNLDVLKEVGVDPSSVDPGNWDQLRQLGAQLHKAGGGTVTRTGFDTKVQNDRLWLWSWANGAEPVSADGASLNLNDPKVVEALEWARSTVEAQGGEQARAAFSQTQNFFSPQNPVLIGQTAITLFEQWLLGVLKANPQANFRAMLPRKRNSTEPITDATGTAFAVPRGVKDARREAAWTFIKGMTGSEAWINGERATAASAKSKSEPYTPTITGNIKADEEVRTTIYQSIAAPYDDAVKLLPDALKAARFRYSGPIAAQLAELLTAAVNDALQGVKPPKQALDEVQQQAQQALDEFAKSPGAR